MGEPYDDFDAEDERLLAEWRAAEEAAVAVLRRHASQHRYPVPTAELATACGAIRAGMAAGHPPWDALAKAAGLRGEVPASDEELWVAMAGSLIRMVDDPGLPAEEQAALMVLDNADWLGAVLGLVEAGPGAAADAQGLVEHLADWEPDGSVDPGEPDSFEHMAFGLIVPYWHAVGAIDRDERVTALGVWGLPRALAWAWGGRLDEPPA